MSTITPEAMKKRFHVLQAEIDKIEAKSGPLREKRDAKAQKYAEDLEKDNEAIRRAEKGLFDKKQELAMIARAVQNVGETEG